MQFLTIEQLKAKLGNRGRTTIYRDVAEGRLPKPRSMGGRSYWIESEVETAMADAPIADLAA